MEKKFWKLLSESMLIFVIASLFACSDKGKEEDFSNVPGVKDESWSSIVACNPNGETLECSFTALGPWNLEGSAVWYTVSKTSGSKGTSKISFQIEPNTTGKTRSSEIYVNVDGYKSVQFTLNQDYKDEEISSDDFDMNKEVDKRLSKYYLWNTDYNKLTRDYTIPYESISDNFLEKTLMTMTTNTLDKKWDDYTEDYSLYSYLSRTEVDLSRSVQMAGVNHGIEKEGYTNSYGFASVIPARLNGQDDQFVFVVESVYPSSPASTLNLNRGTIIYEVDDKKITSTNYYSTYFELMLPTKSSLKLNVAKNESTKLENVTVMPVEIDQTPILMNSVIEVGSHKIGYLVYQGFDAAYDDDLLKVIADFKSQNVTDFVLDLRYNGGGHVISSMLLSACIAGNKCKDKIYQYYRYNDDRMADVSGTKKETGALYDSSAGYFYERFLYPKYYGVSLSSYALNMDKLYVLTTSLTASASELIISALRGIDYEVTVIGEQTEGKNVGMEVFKFEKDGYDYELAPITFQGYNAKKETVPENGIKVDYEVADWNGGYVDFGKTNEPLLAKAIELITGKVVAPSRNVGNIHPEMIIQKKYPLVRNHRKGSLVFMPQIEE
ncbi:MAG: peptidase S41 [Bacteroidaceae bacterium]|nr:peptidase S41 [Bacteroidaceae bacterium]